MKLYEISESFRLALDAVTDPESDFSDDEIKAVLENLTSDFSEKAASVAAVITELEGMAELANQESKRLKKLAESRSAKAKWLREYLLSCMSEAALDKIDTPLFRIAKAKCPPSVVIDSESDLPPEFAEIVQSVSIDKRAIKEAILAGREVPGARLDHGIRLSIK